MAVLHLLLAQDAGARAIPKLSGVVAAHDRWLAGRRFLLVPYHLIGAESLDAAVLGGYRTKLQPLLLRTHGLDDDAVAALADSHFVDRPDLGSDTYLDKLSGQLRDAGDDVVLLMAELHYPPAEREDASPPPVAEPVSAG
jgi:hypothetical protein